MEIKHTLVIILHYGSKEFTYNCIDSLRSNNFIEILIVDNDPSQDFVLKSDIDFPVSIFKTGGQMGFAEANNVGVNYGKKSFHKNILLLNNDTIVVGDALTKLSAALENPSIGIVGPLIPYNSDRNKIWSCGGYINKIKLGIGPLEYIKHGYSEPGYEVDYLPGAVIMCSLNLFELVGGLPEKYFLAYEEAEFALQVKKKGYKILAVPNAVVLHHVGLSSDVQPMYFYNAVRNRIRFGQYIYGNKIGFIWGALVTLISNKVPGYQFSLWARGLSDEIMGIPLNRVALQKIKNLTYKVFDEEL